MYEINEYITENGKNPYRQWILRLKDKKLIAKVLVRLERAKQNDFGKTKHLKNARGVHELIIDYGPGYRIYFAKIDRKILLLLAGSDKSDQKRTILKSKEYLSHYKKKN